MTKRPKDSSSAAMLDLWRPPHDAGEPVGCLATTYTFAPGLFDEQCLARFLEIESEPNREDLAYLLERESRLGGVYAGVLVDHTQAGVEHSMRWDVLPVRVPRAKQHAKLSVLAWTRHARIIVTSANLSEPGYRTNQEVAVAVDLNPGEADQNLLGEALTFLRSLLLLVPRAARVTPEIRRAEAFLAQVESLTQGWVRATRRGSIHQRLAFTLPSVGGQPPRSSLEEAVDTCRRRFGSPSRAWVASPFFDDDRGSREVAASLCKLMRRGLQRKVTFCLPAIRAEEPGGPVRLAAPIALLKTPPNYQADVEVRLLPVQDPDKNLRVWHAKLLALRAEDYTALMIGSSNFTQAGMGVGGVRNVEANIVTVVDHVHYGRDGHRLEAVWAAMESLPDPESAEWRSAQADAEEEEQSATQPLPPGFLSATYYAGDDRRIVLTVVPDELPDDWRLHAAGRRASELTSAAEWRQARRPSEIDIPWQPIEPPERLLVTWGEHQAFMPINVDDSRRLPPPERLRDMSADDMLLILAASDPSAAFRVWAKRAAPSDESDGDLDAAVPVDLDPLRRFDLHATFLHRIRRRAKVLADLRANLQRPVWGQQALEWRLRGLIGVEALADRLVRDLEQAPGDQNEALLGLADFLIVLSEVDYQPTDGCLSKPDFERVFRPFLRELAATLDERTAPHRLHVPTDLAAFWERVVARCRR